MARLPNFLVIIRSEKLSGKGQGRGCLGVRKKERFVLGKRTFRSQKSKHFVLRIINLEGKVGDEDIIVIHDGIRPLVDETVLTDVIMKAQIHGNAVTSLPYNEQIFVVNPENEKTTKQYIPREILRRVSTPQAYKFGKLDWAYHEAFEKEIGIKGSAYTNTMMVELGETLYFAAGSDKNIKLTTKDDLEMFKGYLKKEKDNWLK